MYGASELWDLKVQITLNTSSQLVRAMRRDNYVNDRPAGMDWWTGGLVDLN